MQDKKGEEALRKESAISPMTFFSGLTVSLYFLLLDFFVFDTLASARLS